MQAVEQAQQQQQQATHSESMVYAFPHQAPFVSQSATPSRSSKHASKFNDQQLPGQYAFTADQNGIGGMSIMSAAQAHPAMGDDDDADGDDDAGGVPSAGEAEKRRHLCLQCGKRFNRPSSLKIHLNTHTGAKRESDLRVPLNYHHLRYPSL